MKKAFLILLLACFALSAYSQITLAVEPNPKNILALPDTNDIKAHATIVNTGGRDATLLWSRLDSDKPANWAAWVCDANGCYTAAIAMCPAARPVIMPGNTDGPLDVHIDPKGEAGCATIEVEWYTSDDPNTILEKGVFNFDLAGGTCNFSSSVSQIEISNLNIHPNPTTGIFKLTDTKGISRVEVYSILGSKLRSFDAVKENTFDVNNLAPGMYLVSHFDSKGQVLKTVKLFKE